MIVPFQNKKNPGGLSPCIGVCVMDEETEWCKGCYRTLEEITTWRRLTLVEQRKVLLAVTHRRLSAGRTEEGEQGF
ncbi:MAG: hypothetical protein FD149_1930 [Rhodospirillaceae bacterium]|nr:MAG: hypothetical protein FD149_1930 [Rhodospirillaceae bacterium]